MIEHISGDMHFVPLPRQKRSGTDGDSLNFEQYLVENVDAVDRDPASRDDKEQADKHGEDSRGQAEERADSGLQGKEPIADATLQGRRIDLRA